MERRVDRLLAYLDFKGISENRATIECGLSKGLICQAKSGRADIGNKAVEKILASYPDLSRVWLLTGEGSMLKEFHEEIPAPAQGGQADAIVELLKEQNAELQAKVDALNQRIGELQALLKKEREEIAGAAGSSFSADAV
jgi:Tfp pilus assembly protein FimV